MENRLTFISYIPVPNNGKGLYQCNCGNVKEIAVYSVTKGITKSCGCLRKETQSKSGKNRFIHGDGKSPEYKAWSSAKGRCRSKSNKDYANYGGRGIQFCERWDNYLTFLQDMGRKLDSSYSLERINVNGNYEPTNCKWATIQEQNANRRIHMIHANKLQELEHKLRLYEALYGPLE